jgi:hypothetical protein
VKHLAYWWLFLWAQAIGIGLAYSFGIFHFAWAADASKLTFAILAVHVLATVWIGAQTWQKSKGAWVNEAPGWFLSELVQTLGMIGTVIGFIMMVDSTIGGMTGKDLSTEELRTMIVHLAKGMGTALWTTLFGLISSAALKTQMNNLESIGDAEDSSPR